MSYKYTGTDNFSKLYINGYTSKEVTLLEGENIKKLTSGNIPKFGMLPACHLNFGNIGKLNFDWGFPSTDPMNLNMFNKLSRLSDIIRGINARCITLIEELKCCQLAELYNSMVIPIFEWVLKDFINTLVSIAEAILKSYQVMKVIFCIVRPVPGNPWTRGAGFDFLKYLYSFVEGFEAVYNWLVDGNPVDMILNPAEAFYKKISSCSPDKKRNERLQNDELRKEDLARIIESFNESTGNKIDQAKLDERNRLTEELLIAEQEYSDLSTALNKIYNSLRTIPFNEESEMYEAEFNKLTKDKLESEKKFNELSIVRGKLDDELDALGPVKEQDVINTQTLVNNFLSKRTLDKLIIDAYNPACSCLLELAGVHGFSPPNIMTLNTWESFDTKATGQVLWDDKARWLTAIEKTKANLEFDKDISTLYVSRRNFSEKFAMNNSKLERNLLTRYANGYALNGNDLMNIEDFGKTIIHHKYIDKSGSEITEDFDINSNYSDSNIIELYSDSGFYSHTSSNIESVFNLNEKRLDEKSVQSKIISHLQLEQRDYEEKLETAWNVLRKDALKIVSYNNYIENSLDELDIPNRTIFQNASDIFGGAVAGAKNIYDNVFTTSTDRITTIDKQLGYDIILSPTPEQQVLIDNRNLAIAEREKDIAAANKVFYNIKETSLNTFNNSILTMASIYNNIKDIAQPAKQVLDAQIMLDRLGTSFDIIKFIDLYNINNNFVMPLTIQDPVTNVELYIDGIISFWAELNQRISRHKGMISRLDRLVEIDNFMVSFVDSELQICGCDILCVILQQILDIITSAINTLIKTIIDRLMKMIMSEQATYIIKLITDKLKCFLMAGEISKNIKKIGDLSSALKKRNSQELDRASDPVGCITSSDKDLVINKIFKNDEVILVPKADNINIGQNGLPINNDPILHPMPDWGSNSSSDVPEPGNTIVNNGAVLGESTTGKNVPELYLDCSRGKLPNVEIEIAPRTKFEILIAFIPGESILNAEVISTPQIAKNPLSGVTDINGNEIVPEDITNPILNLSEIMDKVNKQVKESLEAPIYVENDCSPKKVNTNNLTLCSRDNLIVDNISIIENDTIVNDNHLGKISSIKYYNANIIVHEYFPEHAKADKFGMVTLESNNPYWVYSVPDTVTTIQDPVINTIKEILPIDSIYENTITSNSVRIIENFAEKITKTTIDIFHNINANNIEKVVTTTIEITIISPFRKPNLELLVTFKNSVNSFKIRALLDVVAYDLDDVSIKYNSNLYKGRYPEYVEVGAMSTGTGHQYVLSFERLLYLSTKILKANYLITNAAAVVDSIPRKPEEPNKCILPEPTKTEVINTTAIVDNLNLTINNSILELENSVTNIIVPEASPIPEIMVAPILKSIPFLVLNKEKDILVQIINKKMYLQFPSDSFHISEPTIIDYELIPGQVYMFIFNTNGLTYKMSLITANKEVYSVTGMNTSLIPMQPTIIGGNSQGTATMCGGTILDIIVSKNGNNTVDYYNRSIMGYIPRLSQVLFDFSLFQGSRVFNTISSIENGYATKARREGSLSTEYGYGVATALGKQQSDFYGNILSNEFYQILDGYMDNFFCKDNLGDKDFSISLWVYNKKCTTNHHSIISDDIGKNYIYYDATAGKIVIDFANQLPINIFVTLTDWTNIVLKHNKFQKTFYLIVQDINGVRKNIEFISKNKFSLMSLFAEYNYTTKTYYRNFIGYLSTVSIFMHDIDERTYKDLFKNQKLLVQGMQKAQEVKK